MSSAILLPHMARYAFRTGQTGPGFIACREHILDDHAGTGKPANRSLRPSPKLVHHDATLLSPVFSLTTSSATRIFPAVATNRRRPCSRSVHFRPGRHAFLPENVSRYLKDPYSDANCPVAPAGPDAIPGLGYFCRPAARHRRLPQICPACGWRAVPARYGRSARWPAVPSRCQTRDARPRRGP